MVSCDSYGGTFKSDTTTGFTYLDMRTAVQHRYDDVEYDHTGATLLTKHQAASLLRQVAATVQILISSRCDVLNRISFPVLRVLTCTDSSAEDPLSHYVVQSCPMLLQLTVGHMDSKGLRELPGNMTLLRIESFDEEDMDPVRELSRLRQLSLTADCVRIRQDFFANMHDLEIVNLTIYCVEEGEEEEDDEEGELNVSLFNDEGVRILLHNNARLKDVTLSGFRLTSKSLEYFADYAEHHALERLAIKSSVCLVDEDVNGLAKAGAKSKLQTLSILSDDPEQDRIITIRTFPDRMNTTI